MGRLDDWCPASHTEYLFLDTHHLWFVGRGFEQTVDDPCNILPMLARRMLCATNKFSNHYFLTLVASFAHGVIVFGKTINVVVDDVVAKDGDDDGLVSCVVPPNSGAGNDLKCSWCDSAHKRLGHIVAKMRVPWRRWRLCPAGIAAG